MKHHNFSRIAGLYHIFMILFMFFLSLSLSPSNKINIDKVMLANLPMLASRFQEKSVKSDADGHETARRRCRCFENLLDPVSKNHAIERKTASEKDKMENIRKHDEMRSYESRCRFEKSEAAGRISPNPKPPKARRSKASRGRPYGRSGKGR